MLAQYTTLRLGGPADRIVEAHDDDALVAAVREADAAGEPVLVLAGGSNVVIADEGFRGTVVRVLTRGIERDGSRFDVAAGEDWDAFVAARVEEGLAGIECLSGIPGSIGATPIQNVGAYGQEVASTIRSVRVYDRRSGSVEDLEPEECEFAYRMSAFKRDPSHRVVLRVTYELRASEESDPIRYDELAAALGVELGDTAPVARVRETVLELRRRKGMVLDDSDPDTRSAGSFFTNPVVSVAALGQIARTAGADPPHWPQGDGRIKVSAAWLIQRAGFERGHGKPRRVAISRKHTLALTNRGRGTTADLVELAQEIAAGVHEHFGVELVPEPVFIGHKWSGNVAQ